jgi:Autotransporter beta-domain
MSRFAFVVAFVLLLAGSASAQRPQTREGFWISGGLGYGSLDTECEGCESERVSGVTALLAMGGTPGAGFLVGGELEGWAREVDGVDRTFGHLSGVVYWYPQSSAGFFVKGGAGVATLGADAGPAGDFSESGFAVHGGVGYDVRVGRNLSLTPAAGVFWSSLDAGDTHVLHVGLSVTGH